MSRRHRSLASPLLPNETTAPIVRLWLLRILQKLGAHKDWVQAHGFRDDELAQALELGYETVKSRLRYALGKLRQCMGAYLAPESGA